MAGRDESSLSEATVSWRREKARLAIEVFSLVALLVTLGFTAWSAISAANSAKSASEGVNAVIEQINEGKYQSVYQQQLDLWRLAAEHKEFASQIMGGKDQEAAAKVAARAFAVDFYAYVYNQMAPISNGKQAPLALEGVSGRQPMDVSADEWIGWKSWSYTIAYGFQNSPALCQQLQEAGNAYDASFHAAVENAWLSVATEQDGQNWTMVKVCT
jgi:hypothetical protein